MTATGWQAGLQARLVERDPGTRKTLPGGKVMAATVTSVAGERVRATAIESGHGKSHGQSLGPDPVRPRRVDRRGWLARHLRVAAGAGHEPEPCDRTRF